MSMRKMGKTCENNVHYSLHRLTNFLNVQSPIEGCKRNSVSRILNSKSLSWEVFQFTIVFSSKKPEKHDKFCSCNKEYENRQ